MTTCPFCTSDPFHYIDNGLGSEAVAVTCCDLGDMYFRGRRPEPEEVTVSWLDFIRIADRLRQLREMEAAPTPSIEVGEMVELLTNMARAERGATAADFVPQHVKNAAEREALHCEKIASLLLSLDAERGRLRTALTIAEGVLSNVPYEFETTNGGRIPVTKASEARDLARSALGGV
jgi:hypothetical protein